MGTYIRSTFITDQSEFMDNSQIGKQLGNLLDIPKRPQAPKHIFWDGNMKNLETRFQVSENMKNMKKMFTHILCIMAQTLFQTSSRGSELKQNRFGRKYKNDVNMQSSFKCGSDFLNQQQVKMYFFKMDLLNIILTSRSLSWSF